MAFQLTAARRRLVLTPVLPPELLPRFNSQPPEGGWTNTTMLLRCIKLFQLTAARRRLGDDFNGQIGIKRFQLTAARRRLGQRLAVCRPISKFQLTAARRRLAQAGLFRRRFFCFNSQPPEGGWNDNADGVGYRDCFNSQPPEGGWFLRGRRLQHLPQVSTHSRPKAAGSAIIALHKRRWGFNSQPPEGGWTNADGKVVQTIWFQLTAARRRLVHGDNAIAIL